ncbi:guanylate cyclase activator 1g isoform X1 [Esox lucius]|uniref:guanylate cyclase activator 1g isoform X1 n=1 Tax=Esox lucius TaxID=8010 RepID=UPI001476DDF1|nr:guanylate cyclase activator 1g isoform X1 [Esox lucius]
MGQSLNGEENEELELSDIQPLYTAFMKKCPSGALHLHEFKSLFGVQSLSEEESLYMETIFSSFDSNRVCYGIHMLMLDNVMDFMEFVAAVHLVFRGKLEDRLKWSFKVYDRDGNGKIDRHEARHIIRIIYKIKKNNSDMTPDEICNKIFELVDQNGDDQISLAEFLEGAQKDAWIMDLLKLDVNASGWFKESRKRTLME